MTARSLTDTEADSTTRQGKQKWFGDELRIYYRGLGWLTATEVRAFATQHWPLGSVFLARSSFVPAPCIHGLQAWQWQGRGKRRRKVIWDGTALNWVTPYRFYGFAFPELC